MVDVIQYFVDSRRIWMWNGFRQGNLIPMNWYLNLPYWRTIYFDDAGRKPLAGEKHRHKVPRRRLRTVISNMILMASHVTEHARQLIMGLGKAMSGDTLLPKYIRHLPSLVCNPSTYKGGSNKQWESLPFLQIIESILLFMI